MTFAEFQMSIMHAIDAIIAAIRAECSDTSTAKIPAPREMSEGLAILRSVASDLMIAPELGTAIATMTSGLSGKAGAAWMAVAIPEHCIAKAVAIAYAELPKGDILAPGMPLSLYLLALADHPELIQRP